jgi:hypothetical protein
VAQAHHDLRLLPRHVYDLLRIHATDSAAAERFTREHLSGYGRPIFKASHVSPVRFVMFKLRVSENDILSSEERHSRCIACIGASCSVSVGSTSSPENNLVKSFMGTLLAADLVSQPASFVTYVNEPVLALAANYVLFSEYSMDFIAEHLLQAVKDAHINRMVLGEIVERLLLMQAAYEHGQGIPLYKPKTLSTWLSKLLPHSNRLKAVSRFDSRLINFVQFSELHERVESGPITCSNVCYAQLQSLPQNTSPITTL